jgi:LacI family transcriptional regulator
MKKRKQIVDLAATLNYRPNRTARSLKSNASRVLALVVPDITNPFYAVLFRAVEATAMAKGYTIILCNTDEQPERFDHLLDVLGDRYVDGWLVATAGQSEPYIEKLRKLNAHFLLINRRSNTPNAPWIGPDDFASGQLAARHLLGLGHRRIAYVSADLSIKTMRLRFEGFRAAFSEHSVTFDERLLLQCSRSEARKMASELFNADVDRRPTALFVSNSFALEGVWAATRDAGLRIPQNISLVAYNPMPDASFSGISVPIEEIARRGTERLIAMVGQASNNVQVDDLLPVSFVDLGTTAPPAQ